MNKRPDPNARAMSDVMTGPRTRPTRLAPRAAPFPMPAPGDPPMAAPYPMPAPDRPPAPMPVAGIPEPPIPLEMRAPMAAPVNGAAAPVAAPAPAPAPAAPAEAPRPFYRPPTQPIVRGAQMEGLTPKAQQLVNNLSAATGLPPLTIISGFRDAARNKKAGGANKSQHMHGNALDFDVSGWTDDQKASFLKAGIAAGARGIGIYPSGNSIHLDVRDTPAMWGLNPAGAYAGMSMAQAPAWARPHLQAMLSGNVPAAPNAPAPTMVAQAGPPDGGAAHKPGQAPAQAAAGPALAAPQGGFSFGDFLSGLSGAGQVFAAHDTTPAIERPQSPVQAARVPSMSDILVDFPKTPLPPAPAPAAMDGGLPAMGMEVAGADLPSLVAAGAPEGMAPAFGKPLPPRRRLIG